jgi:hypothetical protein
MGSGNILGKRRLLLLLLVALLVALAPAVQIAGHGFASSPVSAKGGHGKGHGDKDKEHKNKGHRNHGENGRSHGRGNREHGENGENHGKGKKNGHHKIEETTFTAVPLAQDVVTPTPTPPPSEQAEQPATTGTILVIAFDCPAGVDPATVDWYSTCTTASSGVTFRLVLNGAPADSATTGTTDDQGNLTFGDLDPGTYHLTEETGDWCHAESDSVDEIGDVIVNANERSTVWIFHCPAAVAS